MRPRLIHPIDVLVAQIDVEETTFDKDFREADPGAKVFKDPVPIKAQISWGTAEEYRRAAGGDDFQADGHFTFLTEDLTRAALVLHKGDRVSAPSDYNGRYVITELRPTMHYDGQPRALRASFKRLEGNE